MKKIGIITFQNTNNYGANLQAYALKEKVKLIGYKSEILNFIPIRRHTNINKKLFLIKVYRRLTNIFSYYLQKKENNIFKKFQKEKLELGNFIYRSAEDIERNLPNYDIWLAGSDQIWNPSIVYDRTYYFNLKGIEEKKKISYASSFGKNYIEKDYENEILNSLKFFKFISTRELNGAKLLRVKLDRNVYHVLDPVFLFSKEEWLKNFKNKKRTEIKKQYILIYQMETNEYLNILAKRIAKKLKLSIIFLTTKSPSLKDLVFNKVSDIEKIFGIGPEEFINLINNAKFIITNSFHGTAFSIIFEKPFLVLPHSKRNDRIDSILNTLKIPKRLVLKEELLCSDEILLKKSNYNLKESKEYLRVEKLKSENYLKMALEN